MYTVDRMAEMIACAKRELAMRERVYPRLVGSGRMTATVSKNEIEAMGRIILFLEFHLKQAEGYQKEMFG